ncbi:hypothetical protein HU200_041323 [Digitaria exilis]|uniref:Reverse transcriptase zinc-binding domain-containing protein n=1 Tax=Digitaria exilis TaxID=1010633 RepID=A0A835B7A8_9POAL|nr:hypothetical protein HU200_041323 [Digitaria exilis]
MFTVKSAYRLLAEEDKGKRDHSENGASFSTDRNVPHWQKLRRCKVRPEVKVLWWRVSHDFMPSRDNLYRRHIDPLCTCDTCGARDETIFHGLTECTYAWGYWSKLKEFTGVKLPKLDLRSWTEQLLADQFCQERDRSIILCGMSVCGRFGEPGMIADMGGVLLETDSVELVALWRHRKEQRSELAPILNDIEIMARSFSSFKISYVRREANITAHVCAKNASSSFNIWANDPPSFLVQALHNDCNPIHG